MAAAGFLRGINVPWWLPVKHWLKQRHQSQVCNGLCPIPQVLSTGQCRYICDSGSLTGLRAMRGGWWLPRDARGTLAAACPPDGEPLMPGGAWLAMGKRGCVMANDRGAVGGAMSVHGRWVQAKRQSRLPVTGNEGFESSASRVGLPNEETKQVVGKSSKPTRHIASRTGQLAIASVHQTASARDI